MKVLHVLWSLGIASSFVFWPILGKYSGASGAWINTIVMVGSAIGGIGLAYPAMREQPIPSISAFGYLLLAGLINGAAMYFYAVKTAETNIPTDAFVMTVIILMVVMTPVFSYMLNGSVLSVRQWFGLGTALFAVYLLAA